MTCIVGLVEDGHVYVGGDSAGVADWDIIVRNDKKVFVNKDMIFGFTDSFRMGQIIQCCFSPPHHPHGKEDFDYLVSNFMDELMDIFEEKKYSKIENNQASGGTFLLGYKEKLYKVHNDFQVEISAKNYNACGCGESFAMGAMHELSPNGNLAPEEKIEKALSVAAEFSAGVCGPFNVVKL